MSFVRNAASVLGTSAVLAPIALLTSIVLARWLDVAERGLYSVAMTFAGLVVMATQLGWPSATIHRLRSAGSEPRQVVSATLAAWTVVSAVALLSCALLAPWITARFLEGAPARVLVLSVALVPIQLLGAYFGRARQHQDFHTSIDHASPRTTSRELYKGILDERARGVFHGRIHVRPDAQRIDAQQTNRTLLLSDEAQIVTKPQLEIYADDVKCSHGATVGALDPDQLFYLRARGIEPEDARTMLTSAFAGEVLHELPVEALRSYLDCFVLGWLSGGER